MKQVRSTNFVRLVTAAVLSGSMLSVWAHPPGRMTGGGSIYCPDVYRVTFGYQLHCRPDGAALPPAPNSLEINFSGGDNFHLTSLITAVCSGPNSSRPAAPFTTMDGTGDGTFNGQPATISFTLTDVAEPGAGQDTARFAITTASGPVLACGPLVLEGGNNQAHRATGSKQ